MKYNRKLLNSSPPAYAGCFSKSFTRWDIKKMMLLISFSINYVVMESFLASCIMLFDLKIHTKMEFRQHL